MAVECHRLRFSKALKLINDADERRLLQRRRGRTKDVAKVVVTGCFLYANWLARWCLPPARPIRRRKSRTDSLRVKNTEKPLRAITLMA